MGLPAAWTFSQLEKFETCPRQFYHLRVKKDVKDAPNEASKWGERVHEAMEQRLRDGAPLPEGMQQWEGLAKKAEAMPGRKGIELQMALNNAFQPCDWKEAWTRGIVDYCAVEGTKAVALDWKTGKRKLTDQLALYAAYVFAAEPQVDQVEVGFVWMGLKKIDKETFTRESVPIIWQKFLPKVRKLENAYERESWPCRPSGLCNGWCPVRTCEFWKDKK